MVCSVLNNRIGLSQSHYPQSGIGPNWIVIRLLGPQSWLARFNRDCQSGLQKILQTQKFSELSLCLSKFHCENSCLSRHELLMTSDVVVDDDDWLIYSGEGGYIRVCTVHGHGYHNTPLQLRAIARSWTMSVPMCMCEKLFRYNEMWWVLCSPWACELKVCPWFVQYVQWLRVQFVWRNVQVCRRNEMLKHSCVQASEAFSSMFWCILWVYVWSLTQFCLPRHLGFGFSPCSAVYVEIWCVKDMLYAGLAPRHQLAVCCCFKWCLCGKISAPVAFRRSPA